MNRTFRRQKFFAFGTKKAVTLLLVIILSLSITLPSFASTDYVYDDLGRLVEIVRPNGNRTIFTYDLAGNIINISVITANAVEIKDADDLNNIRNNLAGSFRLADDIDLSGVDWLPIGTRTAPFTGVLDGNGYTISNLTVNRPAQNDVGLFGRNGGTIVNLELSDANITGADNTGAIAGHNSANIRTCIQNN
jgi:YD repeat-containing protein